MNWYLVILVLVEAGAAQFRRKFNGDLSPGNPITQKLPYSASGIRMQPGKTMHFAGLP